MEKLVLLPFATIKKYLVIFSIFAVFFLVILQCHESLLISSIYDSWQLKLINGNRKLTQPIGSAKSHNLSLTSLVKGENLPDLESTGVSCNYDTHTEECVIIKPVILDKQSQIIYVPSSNQRTSTNKTVRPYARREDNYCMNKLVSQVQIIQGDSDIINPPICQVTHNVPVIVFSFGGYTDNHFHAINDVIIPLFITSRSFRSEVQFVITDFNATRVGKYDRILKKLSSYEIINGNDTDLVHCFPAAVVGLRYHNNLAVNSSKIPCGYTFDSFRQFLRETYNLKRKATSKPKIPKVLLLSRQKSRRILNEDEMVNMINMLGFQVHKALPTETSTLDKFAQIVNSCDMIIGVHGAGFTNQIFLPVGAVVIQIVPLALEWQSKEYFGKPANDMSFKYLEYKVEANETSLYDLYGPNDPIVYNPSLVWAKGWVAIKPIYVDHQDFKINLARFRSTLVQALIHLDSTHLLS